MTLFLRAALTVESSCAETCSRNACVFVFRQYVLRFHVSDIDECGSSPCVNGATCNDNVHSYSCTCASGYGGDRCDRGTFLRFCAYLINTMEEVFMIRVNFLYIAFKMETIVI